MYYFSDINLRVTSLAMGSDVIIPRGYKQTIPITVMLAHPGGTSVRTVVPLIDNKYNFKAYYAISERIITNGLEFLNNNAYWESNMSESERHKGIDVKGTNEIGGYGSGNKYS